MLIATKSSINSIKVATNREGPRANTQRSSIVWMHGLIFMNLNDSNGLRDSIRKQLSLQYIWRFSEVVNLVYKFESNKSRYSRQLILNRRALNDNANVIGQLPSIHKGTSNMTSMHMLLHWIIPSISRKLMTRYLQCLLRPIHIRDRLLSNAIDAISHVTNQMNDKNEWMETKMMECAPR